MNYNVYRFTDQEVVSFPNTLVPSSIDSRLLQIENSIIENFLEAQKDTIGIKNLGNKIRYDKNINKQLNYVDKDNNVLIKFTENRRSFKHVFLESLYRFHEAKIFFLILENDFGKESNLVDSSFITIEEIREEIIKFFSFFKADFFLNDLLFIEFKGFKNCRVEVIEQYSKIHCDE